MTGGRSLLVWFASVELFLNLTNGEAFGSFYGAPRILSTSRKMLNSDTRHERQNSYLESEDCW